MSQKQACRRLNWTQAHVCLQKWKQLIKQSRPDGLWFKQNENYNAFQSLKNDSNKKKSKDRWLRNDTIKMHFCECGLLCEYKFMLWQICTNKHNNVAVKFAFITGVYSILNLVFTAFIHGLIYCYHWVCERPQQLHQSGTAVLSHISER